MRSVRVVFTGEPVKIGEESVTELTIPSTGRAYREVEITLGEKVVTYNPHKLAAIGVRAAGRPAAEAFVDKMDLADIGQVANTVLGFIMGGQPTGGTASP